MLAKSALVLVISVHGLIHLMGFAKAFGFAEVTAVSQPISKGVGLAWLIACLILLLAAVMLGVRHALWWAPAMLGALMSQGLILTAWQSAKFGTVANLIILVAAVFEMASWRFATMVEAEVRDLVSSVESENGIVTEEALSGLPPIVQKWLRRSGVVGKPAAQLVAYEQKGRMKMKPEGDWVRFTAQQVNTTAEPQFEWTVHLASPVPINGRDKYIAGHGNMLIQVGSLLTVVNAAGPETDQGSLMRYLAEIVWYPSVALQSWLFWEETNPRTAKATLSHRGQTVSGVFTFTPEGDFDGFEAQRYYTRPTGPTLETWVVRAIESNQLGGIRLPTRCEVSWHLKEGIFTWLEIEVTKIQTDPSTIRECGSLRLF